METRKIGSLSVSLVGIGCNNFGGRIDVDQTAAVVGAALDEGITLFDTADMYGNGLSEEFLGKALGKRRDEVIVATKFGAATGAKPENVAKSCEASLRRLGTDRIDLYQLHRPDDNVPIEETLGAMNTLVDAGKVVEIGCSNFDGTRIDGAERAASEKGTARFVSVQNQLNLLDRRQEEDLLASTTRHNLGILPYFPLASGMLTGKYRRGEAPPQGTRLAGMPEERRQRAFDDRNFDIVERLESFARERNHTLLELAMSWLACLPNMASVIAGATKPEQVKTNAAAVGWKLTDAEMAEIDSLARR
jgi:aryl-alcohol dehydrogenase-like predicted oxidoreductase